jgi:hypothetical protein
MAKTPPSSSEPQREIDPELLRESGRASAIQDLADQARQMAYKAVGLQSATQTALTLQVKRWKRTTMYLTVALLILAFMGFRQLTISEDNKEILNNVEVILGDVEDLLTFVEEVQSEEPNPETQEIFQDVRETRRIICASNDPGMRAVCAELGG